jgi:hypothetical protein
MRLFSRAVPGTRPMVVAVVFRQISQQTAIDVVLELAAHAAAYP